MDRSKYRAKWCRPPITSIFACGFPSQLLRGAPSAPLSGGSLERIFFKDVAEPAFECMNPNSVPTIVAPQPAAQLVRVNLILPSRFMDRDLDLTDEATYLVQLLNSGGGGGFEQRPGFHLHRMRQSSRVQAGNSADLMRHITEASIFANCSPTPNSRRTGFTERRMPIELVRRLKLFDPRSKECFYRTERLCALHHATDQGPIFER